MPFGGKNLENNGLRKGDRNTKYFYYLVSHHRRNNFISSLRFGNILIEGNQELRDKARKYFTELFTEPMNLRPILNGLSFNSLDSERSLELEKSFTEDEIFKGLKDCNRDKVPGPDGFPMGFL